MLLGVPWRSVSDRLKQYRDGTQSSVGRLLTGLGVLLLAGAAVVSLFSATGVI